MTRRADIADAPMPPLPPLALSVRQPWAWAIVHAGKHLENRSWGGWGADKKRKRGPICIHASSGMTRDEYEHARDFMGRYGVNCPPPADLVRGAIIGTASIVDWVTKSHSFWFMGPGALVLEAMTPLPEPIPCSGALGFFAWKRSGEITPPARWMIPKSKAPSAAPTHSQGTLL